MSLRSGRLTGSDIVLIKRRIEKHRNIKSKMSLISNWLSGICHVFLSVVATNSFSQLQRKP